MIRAHPVILPLSSHCRFTLRGKFFYMQSVNTKELLLFKYQVSMTLNSLSQANMSLDIKIILLMNYCLSYNCWLVLTLLGKCENVQNPVCPSSTTKGLLRASEKPWNKYHMLCGLYFWLIHLLKAMLCSFPPSPLPFFISPLRGRD